MFQRQREQWMNEQAEANWLASRADSALLPLNKNQSGVAPCNGIKFAKLMPVAST
jgi:hypothetical protein